MTSPTVADALKRAERLLFATPVLESLIARQEAGEWNAGDQESADAVAEELASHQSTDGSWGGCLAVTAEALLLLADLQASAAKQRAAIERAIAWVRSRQRMAGAFAGDCTPDHHAAGFCPHFATGFFSPAPPATSMAGTGLANGARFATDEDARLALSALALRAVLSHAAPRMDDLLQIQALRRIADLLFRDGTGVSTVAAVTVLATLTRAPRNATLLSIVHGALSRLTRLQRADGSWSGAEMFHVADTLLLAVRSGYGSPAFDSALGRTAHILVLTQQPDGSWGSDAGPFRLLTGWRTLRHVATTQQEI